MSYWVVRFGDKDLPRCNAVQDNGMPEIAPAYSQFPYGGVFDAYGAEKARVSLPFPIPVEGTIHLRRQMELYDWRALHGVRDTLYRRRDGAAFEESITARLMSLKTMRSYVNPEILELQFQFDALEEYWSGEDQTFTEAFWQSPQVIPAPNEGNAIQRNIVITLTADGSAITFFSMASALTRFEWTGTLAAGNSLVIDVGAKTVRNNGVDAYAGFSLHTLHRVAEWLRLPPGDNNLTIWRTGGLATTTIQLAYKDAWA